MGGGKGGGGGGGQPTQTTSTSNVSNIPEYARPYVETMLGATQKQLYQMDDSGGITGFQPYKAYGSTYDSSGNQISYDPSKAIAGFSPMQTQAQQGIANMQLPATYGAGAAMTGQAGMGALGTVGQAGMYGGMGARTGQQNSMLSNAYGNAGANIGMDFGQQATDPNAVQAYMNPYLQSSLQPQLQEMERQYGITGAQEMGNATKAGAFGGNREALMAAENQRNKNIAMNQAIGQGYNTAFNNAQQQMGAATQYGMQGAGMGLQGAQQAGQLGMQGAQAGLAGVGAQQAGYGQLGAAGSSLANIGGQALQAQQGIYGAQNQVGAAQQAQQQQIINQSMQDYANAQQYPLMQLGVMSNMLRGLPMQAATTNQYVAAPNQVTQGIGLAGAGASIMNAMKKEGGVIKEMASGGIASYRGGDLIDETENDLYDMPVENLQRELKSPSPTIRRMAERIIREKTGKAGGGIIAFANPTDENNQSVVKEDPAMVRQAYIDAARAQAVESGYEPPAPPTPAPGAGRGRGSVSPQSIVAAAPVEEAPTAQSRVRGKALSIADILKPSDSPRLRAARASEALPVEVAPTVATAPPPAAPPNALPPAPTGVKLDDKGRANAADQSPAAVPPKVVAPVENKGIGLVPNQGLVPNIGGIKFPTKPVEETQAELDKGAAERVAAYGFNEGNQQARTAAMAEKANAKDEARRMTSLRMAEFFGAWGATPGNTIVAGLNALKNKVPDFISDMKEESKVRRQIDKDIADLDKLDREEKNGIKKDYFAERAKLADRALQTYGHELNAAVHREGNIMQREVGMANAAARGEGSSGSAAKNLNQATMRYQTEDKNIAAEKKGDEEYKMAKRTLSIPSKANDPKALEIVKKKEAAWNDRLVALKEDVDYYKQKQGRETRDSGATNEKPKVIKLD